MSTPTMQPSQCNNTCAKLGEDGSRPGLIVGSARVEDLSPIFMFLIVPKCMNTLAPSRCIGGRIERANSLTATKTLAYSFIVIKF
jgi:hypothetical protein